jgi:hypothetical protein
MMGGLRVICGRVWRGCLGGLKVERRLVEVYGLGG